MRQEIRNDFPRSPLLHRLVSHCADAFRVALKHSLEEHLLGPERRAEAGWTDPHRFRQLRERGTFVSFLDEKACCRIHSFIDVELTRATRHTKLSNRR